MNELKPEYVMRGLENGRYIDADEFWNRRPENPNPDKEGRYIDGWFDCVERFSRTLREMINEETVGKYALALLKKYQAENAEKDAEIERLKNSITFQVILPDEKLEEIKNECLKRVELDIKELRAEAITEFAERLKDVSEFFLRADKDGLLCCVDFMAWIEQTAKELKGNFKYGNGNSQ